MDPASPAAPAPPASPAGAPTLRASPAWTVVLEDDALVLTAGADESYLLDELAPDDARALHRAWHAGSLDEAARSPALASALAKLEKAGAVFRASPLAGSVVPFAVLSLGEGADAVAAALAARAAGAATLALAGDAGAAAVVVVVRAGGGLLAVHDRAGDALLARPHLLVDVAYARTVSVGPFVFPGSTACLSCFAGRVAHAWGDPEPPPRPRASVEGADLAASLALQALRTFQREGSVPALIERVVSLDLATFETRRDHVFRLPWCPRCYPAGREYGTGSFALPWVSPQDGRR